MKTHLHFKSIPSTNIYLKDQIKRHTPELLPMFFPPFFAVTADQQEEGHGRQNKKWESETGKNLLLSLLLYPCIHPSDQFRVCQYVSMGISVLLKDTFSISDVRIKWPNDIYVGDKKIAGILIEHFIKGEFLYCTIVGIGMNINQTVFPDTLPNPTSLSLETGQEYDITFCRKKLISTIKLIEKIPPYFLEKCYENSLYRLGKFSDYILPAFSDTPMSLKITGVDEKGLLQLSDKNNTQYSCAFNEIVYCPPVNS
ncbi:MAG: biotin--[acetyl-CoA-carboxylase] ligase [Bacteroidales bacterium]|jgi:BirA family biotin operon repressor/biotin-[acetyl-CoA-carboxylase] ligase|nr:biotin--[acetyl-CoA-carboxylase] ligase [Bacteroidales bacterium]